MPKLKTHFIGPDDVKNLPYLMNAGEAQMTQNSGQVVNTYVDPLQAIKPVERVVVQQDDVNDRMNLRSQYQQQVFQPGHNLPTMSLEEFADREVQRLASEKAGKRRPSRSAPTKTLTTRRCSNGSDRKTPTWTTGRTGIPRERETLRKCESSSWSEWCVSGYACSL